MMDIDCAVGKTYAAKLLKSYSQFNPEDAKVLTYCSGLTSDWYLNEVSKFRGTFLFFDRYDRYMDDRITNMLDSMRCYRFVVSKNPNFWNKIHVILCETILERGQGNHIKYDIFIASVSITNNIIEKQLYYVQASNFLRYGIIREVHNLP